MKATHRFLLLPFASAHPAFLTPPPLHASTALHAGLRDYVGYPSDGDYNPSPYSPIAPSVRDGGFEFNPFVDDARYYDRNYVMRPNKNRRQSNYYDDFERGPSRGRSLDSNYRDSDYATASRGRRREQRGPYDNDYRDDLNYRGNEPNRRIGGGRNDVPIPNGRSAGQLARMYTNLEEGYSNFNSLTVVERYFEAWNRRNVPLALTCFDESVYYDDTQFSKPFEGKDDLAKHLIYVADCVPESFRFVLDGLAVGPAIRRRNNFNIDRRRRNSQQSFNPVRALNIDRRSNNYETSYDNNIRSYDSSNLQNLVNIAALWHVESDSGPIPFGRGCSFYYVNPNTNLIVEGYDFPEPAVIKPGSSGLKLLSIASKLIDEPIRFIPFAVWVTYIYVVFFSNGILPGKDVLQAEPRSWEEVRALSLNFFYVSPILGLKLSPSIHPCLEAIFNTLLAWAFLFMGFLSDERTGVGSEPYYNEPYYEKLSQRQEEILADGRILVPPVSPTKRNLISILPTVIGMQFLLSAFLLPYLFCRTSERSGVSTTAEIRRPRSILTRPLYKEELDRSASIVGEWRGLGIIMGAVGLLGVYWFFNGRVAEFGPPLWESPKRMQSFMKLLSIDRVGSSFIVDLVIFTIFQGWLVDDDWKRRGRSMDDDKFLRNVAKFVPFWGLACYLTFRPGFPSRNELDVDEIDARGFLNSRYNKNSMGNDFGQRFNDFGRNFYRGANGDYNPRRDEFDMRR